jgi:hypothetical protein
VNAGSRMCQPITRANCNRGRKTGSNSISVTPDGRCSARKVAANASQIRAYDILDALVTTAA